MVVLLLIGVALIAYLAYRYQTLTVGGAWMAFLVGMVIALSFSYKGLIILALFFIGSTIFGRLPARTFEREKETRTAGQVFANGGVAALLAISGLLFADDELARIMFISALAAANSDTWATEGGKRWGGRPYHIRTSNRTTTGRSGAISPIGTLFAFIGSAFIAVFGSFLFLNGDWVVLILIAGFAGAMADTVIGAYLQEERQCEYCNTLTEEKNHCGHNTRIIRGVPGVDNNKVNVACTIVSPMFAMIIFLLV
ncbi:DUF92 domain-containing protein [Salicibibacter cibarius]|uniref:DUF92 domain-containing protein n=1 Tax=Salicibibacter cibarius TaxID=2743000 RepID=A0A7T6Z338_9BACI|nr:DUF92 domain-containing protein [Salicibibacter cibarius]QQK75876.1 DUF92 domain-containing protein [Salicibibacter cibarius]